MSNVVNVQVTWREGESTENNAVHYTTWSDFERRWSKGAWFCEWRLALAAAYDWFDIPLLWSV